MANLCQRYITLALRQHYSDIHFTPLENSYLIQLRSGSDLRILTTLPLDVAQRCLTYLKYNSGLDMGEQQLPQSGRLQLAGIDAASLRLSLIPNFRSQPSAVIRCVPLHITAPLALFDTQRKQLYQLITKKTGLLLFSGPVGSGKTATIAHLLEHVTAHYNRKIITVEDPVERPSSAFLQFQINENAQFTFDVVLRAILRHDPDIVMIGEIRDALSAQMAIRIALTGHLVVATIHATDATGVLFRLNNFGVTALDIEQTVEAVIAQQFISLAQTLTHRTLSPPLQRALIYEIVTAERLDSLLHTHQLPAHLRFPYLFKKGVRYGFIDPPN
ncbi:ATPase, T2SS/T4P/T4SS family [Brochothrix campestris]